MCKQLSFLITGDLIPHHQQIFRSNVFFSGVNIPEPDTMVAARKGVVGKEEACVLGQHLVFVLIGTIGQTLSGCVSSCATSDEGRSRLCVNVLSQLQTCSKRVTPRHFWVSSHAW